LRQIRRGGMCDQTPCYAKHLMGTKTQNGHLKAHRAKVGGLASLWVKCEERGKGKQKPGGNTGYACPTCWVWSESSGVGGGGPLKKKMPR